MDLAWCDSRCDALEVIQTSESSVSIEVPKNWRLWSGWRPRWWRRQGWDDDDHHWRTSEWEELGDPMDNNDFDMATAFPALKPDGTVFHVGLPDYTRNQRGWYHIKPWPLRSLLTVSADERGATGADVPVELFDILLKYIRLEREYDYDDGGIPMDKRELGLISLACGRWARTLRPLIFRMITLRSIEDAHTLLSFLHHPHSSIAPYIDVVVLSQSLTPYPYLPWVHRTPVFDQIMGALKTECPDLEIAFCGPLPNGKFTKGICEMLPRSVPWAFIGVKCLHLKDLQFKKLGDLMRIPRELPSLRTFICRDIIWEDTSPEELPPTSQYLSWRTDSVEYELRSCTDDRAAAWLAALLAPRWRDRLEESDAHQICRIASALSQNLDGRKLVYSTAYRLEESLYFYWPKTGSVTVYFTDRVARQARRVRAIEWDVSRHVDEQDLECSDWEAIDRLTMALPSLGTLLIRPECRDDVLLFHKKVVTQKMPSLHGSNKLKYALKSYDSERHPDRYIYTPVACSGDKVHVIGPTTQSITPEESLLPSAEQSLPAPVASGMAPSLMYTLLSFVSSLLSAPCWLYAQSSHP
ncbi:hypothetical protein NM688_g2443 [Phlebia brevispora]|uniref:Uncharacterized protein n=1 Tax=Phlebia brevispora TaxID=194682 RepID=A0ACC1T8G6_9APHY|nr:hypothetical protein NM688_g2443 [Phlebia brevispora]